MERGAELETIALGEPAQEIEDNLGKEGPKQMCQDLSGLAQEFIAKLEDAGARKDA